MSISRRVVARLQTTSAVSAKDAVAIVQKIFDKNKLGIKVKAKSFGVEEADVQLKCTGKLLKVPFEFTLEVGFNDRSKLYYDLYDCWWRDVLTIQETLNSYFRNADEIDDHMQPKMVQRFAEMISSSTQEMSAGLKELTTFLNGFAKAVAEINSLVKQAKKEK